MYSRANTETEKGDVGFRRFALDRAAEPRNTQKSSPRPNNEDERT